MLGSAAYILVTTRLVIPLSILCRHAHNVTQPRLQATSFHSPLIPHYALPGITVMTVAGENIIISRDRMDGMDGMKGMEWNGMDGMEWMEELT